MIVLIWVYFIVSALVGVALYMLSRTTIWAETVEKMIKQTSNEDIVEEMQKHLVRSTIISIIMLIIFFFV